MIIVNTTEECESYNFPRKMRELMKREVEKLDAEPGCAGGSLIVIVATDEPEDTEELFDQPLYLERYEEVEKAAGCYVCRKRYRELVGTTVLVVDHPALDETLREALEENIAECAAAPTTH